MAGVIFAIIILGVLVGFARTAYDTNLRTQTAWQQAGQELGLTVKPGSMFSQPRMHGSIDGVHVTVSVESTGNNNNQRLTTYRVTHDASGPPVVLLKQHAFSMLGRLIGRRDVEVGDPFFDDKVVVDSKHSDEVRAFLTPARRAVILELFERWHQGEISHNHIQAQTINVQRSADRLVATVDRVVAMAHVMGNPGPVNAALSHHDDGNLADAAAELHALNEQDSNIFTQVLEAEALVELGDHDGAAEVFHQVEAAIPAEVTPGGWEQLADSPAPAILPAPARASSDLSAPRVVVSQERAPDQQVVIDDLFNGTRLSFEIVEQFEQHYVNRSVSWEGVVTATRTYRHDTDFGAGPGRKATVLLGGSGRSSLISNEVHAVIQLPEDAAVTRDTTFSFAGTLVRVDRFARKLYIANATAS